MRQYETAFLIAPNLPEEDNAKLISQMAEVVSKQKGKMINVDEWGKRKLAYPIQKFEEAYYVFFLYEGEPAIPVELERRFKQTETIIRYMTIKSETAEGAKRRGRAPTKKRREVTGPKEEKGPRKKEASAEDVKEDRKTEPEEEPAEKPTEKPAEKPAGEPDKEPKGKPAEEEAEKPGKEPKKTEKPELEEVSEKEGKAEKEKKAKAKTNEGAIAETKKEEKETQGAGVEAGPEKEPKEAKETLKAEPEAEAKDKAKEKAQEKQAPEGKEKKEK
jgi:small subunit ribosomal protein S6